MKCQLKIKYLCFFFFLSLFGAYFVPSYSANALDLSISSYSTNDSGSDPYCRFYDGSNWSSYRVGSSPGFGGSNPSNIDGIECRHIADDIHIDNGDYIEMFVRMTSPNEVALYNGSTGLGSSTWLFGGETRGISAELVNSLINGTERYDYYRLISRYQGSGWTNTVISPFRFFNDSSAFATDLYPSSLRVISWTVYKPTNDAVVLNNIDNSVNNVDNSVNNPEYIQQEKSDLQEQAQVTENTANSDSEESQQVATNLLSIVSAFVTAVNNADEGDCSLDGNLLPHLPLGSLNLCSFPVPTAVSALGSLILIGVLVPFAYHVVIRFLNLIHEMQGY